MQDHVDDRDEYKLYGGDAHNRGFGLLPNGSFFIVWDAFLHDRKYRLDGLVKLLPSFLTEVSKIAHWLVVGRL
jgi:hypothetical protein